MGVYATSSYAAIIHYKFRCRAICSVINKPHVLKQTIMQILNDQMI